MPIKHQLNNSEFGNFVDAFKKYITEHPDGDYTLLCDEEDETVCLYQLSNSESRVIAEIRFIEIAMSDIEIGEAIEFLESLAEEYNVFFMFCDAV